MSRCIRPAQRVFVQRSTWRLRSHAGGTSRGQQSRPHGPRARKSVPVCQQTGTLALNFGSAPVVRVSAVHTLRSPNACGIHIRCTNAARASVNAGQQARAAMLDHLGGDADGDLLGRLRLDGNADGHVHLCDLVFGEPRLGELRVHERRLLLAA